MFFTLFGAVAVVGVLGAGIMATMRGPLSTMVEVNRIEETKAEMRLAMRLILVASGTQADPDTDAITEPIDPDTCAGAATNAGCIPASVGSKKSDPWGTKYSYCAWNLGTDFGALGDNILAGTADTNNIVIALISAGPDRTFNNGCSAPPTFITDTPLGDDLIERITYTEAVEDSGGLWVLNPDGDAATIDKDIEVTGSATFTGNIDLSTTASAQLKLGAASLALPTQTTLSNCNSGNNLLLRILTGTPPVLQMCDGASNTWISAAGRWDISGTLLYYEDGNVAIGTDSADDALDVAGNIGVTGNIELGTDLQMQNGRVIGWNSGSNGATISGNSTTLTLDGNGSNTELTIGTNAVDILGDMTITGTTADNSIAALNVMDSTSASLLFVRNDGNVGIGDATPTDRLEVAGDIDTSGTYKINDRTILNATNSSDASILLGVNAGSSVSGDDNVIIGSDAGDTLTTGTNNIIIGAGQDVGAGTTSNTLNIGGTIYGDLSNDYVGIGTSTFADGDALEVAGSIDASGAVKAASVTASGDIESTGGAVTANGDVTGANIRTALGGSVYASEDVDAGDDVIAGGQLRVGNDVVGPVPSCADNNKKLAYTGSNWSCVDITGGSELGGTGTNGALTIEDILSNGDDANNEDLDDVGRLGADKYCQVGLADADCVEDTELISVVKAGASRWATSGDDIYNTNSGYVGVGTSSPLATLHASSSTGDFRVTATSNNRYLLTSISGASVDMYNANFNINRYSSSHVLLARGGGNVSVGSIGTDPAELLHVYQDADDEVAVLIQNPNAGASARSRIKFQNDIGGAFIGLNSGSSNLILQNTTEDQDIVFWTKSDGSSANRMSIKADGSIGIGDHGPDDGSGFSDGQDLQLDVEGPIGGSYYCDESGRYCFTALSVFDLLGEEDLWFLSNDGSTVYNANSNVGIGVNATSVQLEVMEEVNAASDNTVMRLTRGVSNTPTTGVGAAIDFNIETANDNYELGASIAAVATSVTSDNETFDLVFNTASADNGAASLSEAMRITAKGNVGIGSINPTHPLTIVSNRANAEQIRLERSDDATERSQISFINDGAPNASNPYYYMGLTANNYDFRISTWDGTAPVFAFTIKNDGDVGIGDTTPDSGDQDLKFDVEGPVGGTHYCDNLGNNCFTAADIADLASGNLDWDDFADAMTLDASTSIDMNSNSANFTFDTGDNTLFIDGVNNRVGIGTASPNVTLDVQGNIYATGGNIAQFSGLVMSQLSGDPVLRTFNGNDPILFATNNGSAWTERMRIDADGNVGIGFNNPSQGALDIKGNIYLQNGAGSIYSTSTDSDRMLRFIIDSGTDALDRSTIQFSHGGAEESLIYSQSDGVGGADLVLRTVGGASDQIILSPNSIQTLYAKADTVGRIGIGFNDPSQGILDVNGDIYSAGNLAFNAASASGNIGALAYCDENGENCVTASALAGVAGGQIDWDDIADAMTLDATTNIDMAGYDLTFNSGSFVFDGTNGRLGIGVTSPSYPLDVDGVGVFRTTNGYFRLGGNFPDLVIYDSNRCKSDGAAGSDPLNYCSGNHRALVQSATDILHVNFEGDFQGGTNIQDGALRVTGGEDIGLGTNAPSTDLHLFRSSGDAIFTIQADPSNSEEQDNPFIHFKQDGNVYNGYIGYTGNAETGFNKVVTGALANAFMMNTLGTGTALQLGTDDTARLTILENGDVGIGTNAPSSNLHVIGDAQINLDAAGSPSFHMTAGTRNVANPAFMMYRWTGTGDNYRGFKIERGTATASNNNPPVTFSVANSAAIGGHSWVDTMTFDDAGNVGIGTNAPSSKLHVKSGAITITGDSAYGPIFLENPATSIAYNSWLGGINFKNNDSDNPGVAARIIGAGDGTTGQAKLDFFTGEPGDVNLNMTILSNGRVGIGTNAPSTTLHIVNNSSNPRIRIGSESNTQIPYLEFVNSTGSTGFHTGGDANYLHYDGSAIIPATDNTGNLGIGTYRWRNMHIMSALIYNKVGIGFNDPSQGKLDVNGDIYSAGNLAFNSASASGNIGAANYCDENGENCFNTAEVGALVAGELDWDALANAMTLDASTDIDTGVYDFSFNSGSSLFIQGSTNRIGVGTNAPEATAHFVNTQSGVDSFRVDDQASDTTYFVIDEDGNVGIGTSDTTDKLVVQNGDIRISDSQALQWAGGAARIMGVSAAGSGGHLAIFVDQNEQMRLIDGAIGIGTNAPSYKLHVNGGSIATSHGLFLGYGANAERAIAWGDSSTIIGANATGTSDYMYFRTNGSEAMRIDANGNVGIGTNSPSAPVHVYNRTPTLRMQDADGPSTNWTDYKSNQIYAGSGFGIISTLNLNLRASSASSNITFTTQDAEAMRIDENGNIGIGTNEPSTALHISGLSGTASELRLSRSDYGNRASVGLTAPYGDPFVSKIRVTSGYGTSADAINIAAATNSSMTLGNVGIGTNAPSTKLEVAGAANQFTMRLTGANSTSKVGIDMLDPTAPNFGARVYFNDALNGLVLNTVNSKVETNGIFIMRDSGRVGIGETFPDTGDYALRLDVDGNIGAPRYCDGDGYNCFQPADVAAISTGEIDWDDIANNMTLDATTTINMNGQDLNFGGNILWIDSSQSRVGINAPSDQTLDGALHIITDGDNGLLVHRKSADNGDYADIRFRVTGSHGSVFKKGGIAFERTGSNGRGSLHFMTNNDDDNSNATLSDSRMAITTAGNVGIGTNTPSSLLHVTGIAEATNGFKVTDETGTASSSWDGGTNYIRTMRVANNTTNLFRVNSGLSYTEYNSAAWGTYWRISRGSSDGFQRVMEIKAVDNDQRLDLYDDLTTSVGVRLSSTGDSFFNGGNVGIGTNAPSAKLHIKGSGAGHVSEVFRISSTATLNTLRINEGGTIQHVYGNTDRRYILTSNPQTDMGMTGISEGGLFLGENSTHAAITGRNGGAQLAFWTNNEFTTPRMVIDGSGNVGIGTNAPSQLLHIVGDGTNDYMIVGDNAGNDLLMGYDGQNARITSRGDGVLHINYNSGKTTSIGNGSTNAEVILSESLYVKANGNVGIGTNAPSVKLHIEGSAQFTERSNPAFPHSIVVNGRWLGHKAIDDETNPRMALGYDVPGVSGINHEGLFLNRNGNSTFDQQGVAIATADARQLGFYISNGSSLQERMRIDQDGNVGIGFNDPSQGKLDVKGDIYSSGNLSFNSASASGNIGATQFCDENGENCFSSSEVGALIAGELDWDALANAMTLDASTDITTGSYDFSFNGGSSLFIDGDTNSIGVGTNTPQATAHIVNDGVGDSFRVDDEYNDTTYLVIDDAGDVGIGTGSPAGRLHARTDSGDIDMILTDSISTDAYNLDVATGTGRKFMVRSLEGANRQAMVFSDAGIGDTNSFFGLSSSNDSGVTWNPRFVVKQDGNIGMGIKEPDSNLHIYAETGDAVLVLQTDPDNDAGQESDNPHIEFRQDGNGYRGFIGMGSGPDNAFNRTVTGALGNDFILNASGTDAGLQIATNNAVRMKVTSSGNVGVGTNSPSSKLHVNGGAVEISNSVPRIIFDDTEGLTSRPRIEMQNNDEFFFIGEDDNPEVFRFMSTYSNNRTNAAMITVHGPSTSDWGVHTVITHNGTVGRVGTSVGDLVLAPEGLGVFRLSSDGLLSLNSMSASAAVGAQEYCDENGENCIAAADLARGDVGHWTLNETTGAVYNTASNVGIGTNEPSTKLHLVQASGVAMRVTAGTGGANIAEFVRKDIGTTQINISASGLDPHIQFNPDGQNWAIGADNDDNDSFKIVTTENSLSGGTDRFVINSNGNVGIGDSDTPGILTITDTNDVTGNSGGSFIIQEDTGDATGIKLRMDANELQATSNGASSQFYINAAGSPVYVGGTSGAGRALNVIEASSVTASSVAALYVLSQTSGVPAGGFGTAIEMALETSNDNIETGARIDTVLRDGSLGSEDADIVFNTLSDGTLSESLRISSKGKIGIGNTNPTSQLDVKMDVAKFGTGTNGISLRTDSAAYNSSIDENDNFIITKIGTGGAELKLVNSSNNFSFFDGSSTGTVAIDTPDNVATQGGDQPLKLEVGGAVGAPYFCDDAGLNCFSAGGLTSGSAISSMADGDGDTKIQVEEGEDDDTIRFDTNGVQRMIINSAGNIGIGFNNPARAFMVANYGDGDTIGYPMRIHYGTGDSAAAGIGTGLEFFTETSAINNEIGATITSVATDVTADSEDFDLVFNVMSDGNAAGEALRITSAGDLEFANSFIDSSLGSFTLRGTSGVWGRLNTKHIDALTGGTLRLNFYETGNVYVGANGEGTRSDLEIYGGLMVRNAASSAIFDVNDTNGYVGIGAANPVTPIHINLADPVIRLQDSDTNAIAVVSSRNDGALSLSADIGNTAVDSEIIFNVDGSEGMRLNASLNLGIGTNAPSSNLHISGGASGDAVLTLEANSDNDTSYDNPYMQFIQDAGTINGFVGLLGSSGWPTDITGGGAEDDMYIAIKGDHGINFATNSQSRLYLDGNGNVGIGTNEPSEKLHVDGSIQLSDSIVFKASTGSTTSGWDNGSNAITTKYQNGADLYRHQGGIVFTEKTYSAWQQQWRISRGSGDGYQRVIEIQGSDSNQKLDLFDGTTNTVDVRLSGSGDSFIREGNVGIGTNAPSDKLHVVGDGSATNQQVVITDQTNGNSGVIGVDDNGVMRIGGRSATDIGVKGDDLDSIFTSSMRVRSGGVSIGHVNEASSGEQTLVLDVAGAIGGTHYCDEDGNNCVAAADLASGDVGHWTLNAATGDVYNTASNIGIGTNNPFDSWNFGANPGLEINGADPALGLHDSGGERWLITAGTGSFIIRNDTDQENRITVTNSGDVGIGTNAPSSLLHVSGGDITISNGNGLVSETGASIATGVGGSTWTIRAASSGDIFNALLGDGTNVLAAKASGRVGIHNNNPDAIFHITQADTGPAFIVEDMENDTTPFQITSDGDVGIGTNEPSEKLHVVGNTSITADLDLGNIAQDATTITFSPRGWNGSTYGDVVFKTARTASNFSFENNTGDREYFYISGGSGNAGIGTNTPSNKLHLYDASSDAVRLTFGNDDAPDDFSIGMNANEAATIWHQAARSIYFGTNNSTRMIIGASGNVAIGAADPSVGEQTLKLDVEGPIGGTHYCDEDGNNCVAAADLASGDVGHWTLNAATGDVYNTTSNIGIGTDSPSRKLTIEGSSSGSLFSIKNNTLSGDYMIGVNSAGVWDVELKSYLGSGQLLLRSGASESKVLISASSGVSSYFNAGDVGIGNNEPSVRLHVSDNNAEVMRISRIDNNHATLSFGNSSGEKMFIGTTPESAGTDFAIGPTVSLNSNGYFYVKRDTGNIGLGDITPDASLEISMNGGTTEQSFMVSSDDAENGDIFIIDENGDVGIGTNAPSVKLHVDATAAGEAAAKIINKSGSGGEGLHIETTAGNGVGDALKVVTYRSNTARNMLRIPNRSAAGDFVILAEQTGNVGIGTNAPSTKLHVSAGTSGDAVLRLTADTDDNDENDNPFIIFEQDGGEGVSYIGMTGGSDVAFNKGVTGAIPNSLVLNSSIASAHVQIGTNNAVRMTVRGDGNVGIGDTTPNTGEQALMLDVEGPIGGTHYCDEDGNNCVAAADLASGDVGHWTLNAATGDVYNTTSNIGIGVATPDTTLHVSGLTTLERGLGSAFVTFKSAGENFGYITAINDGSGNPVLGINAGGTADTLVLQTAGTEAMRINASGNVGIGTNAPSEKLHIAGTGASIRIQGNPSAGSDSGIDIFPTGISDAYVNLSSEYIYGGTGTNNLRFGRDLVPANAAMSINTSTGNVGIGTDTPISKLTVAGSGALAMLIGADSGAGTVTDSTYKTSGIAMPHYDTNEEPLGLIYADIGASSSTMRLGGGSSAANAVRKISFYTAANSNTTTGSERMTIDRSGLVGIGTNEPSERLHVMGNIRYTGILIDSSDERLKTDITPLRDRGALMDRLQEIKGYSFTMKGDERGQVEYGVIAQEIERVFPELVTTDDTKDGYKSVNYIGLIAPLIEASKELDAQNKELAGKLQSIEADLDARVAAAVDAQIQQKIDAALDGRLAALEADMKGLKAHTGYGISKASAAMMALMLLLGIGGTMVVVNRRKWFS